MIPASRISSCRNGGSLTYRSSISRRDPWIRGPRIARRDPFAEWSLPAVMPDLPCCRISCGIWQRGNRYLSLTIEDRVLKKKCSNNNDDDDDKNNRLIWTFCFDGKMGSPKNAERLELDEKWRLTLNGTFKIALLKRRSFTVEHFVGRALF